MQSSNKEKLQKSTLFVLALLFIAANVYSALWRKELWPISTYDMFSRATKVRMMFRPAYLENGQPHLIPFVFNSKWFRQKYTYALKEKNFELINEYLKWDCSKYFDANRCKNLDLVLVKRVAQPSAKGPMQFYNQVVYELKN